MAKRNRKTQRANARKRKAAAKREQQRNEAAAEAEQRAAEINAALALEQEESDEEFSRNFVQSAEDRHALEDRLRQEERMETSDSGSAPASPTLRNTIGLQVQSTVKMTLEEQLAAAASHGVEPELGRAAHRLFGPDGPKPDDHLTPEQLQDVHMLFDVLAKPEAAEVEADAGDEPLSCQICFKPYGPFERPCGHVQQVQAFPEWDWKARGCVCPNVEICMECVQKEAFESAVRCCVNPLCKGIVMKCPWCREDVSIGDMFYKMVLSNGDPESQRRARATLAQEGL